MPESRVVARQCQLCEAHCGVLVNVEGESVTRIEGNPDDVLSKGYICPKGTALWDLHADPERLRAPLVRVGDGFEEATWDEAFALIGRRLRAIRRQHGADAVGLYQGNPTAHSSSALAIEALKKVLRSRNVFSASSVDQFPQYLAATEMLGSHVLMPIADVDRTDHLLVIGANPAVSNGSITTMPDARGRLKAITARGGRVVVVDPRRTETARIATEHVAVRPGGDPALLLGMLHVIFAENLASTSVPVAGLPTLRALAAGWSPDRAADPSGVDADTITRMAREFATADSACAYGRIGVCHHTTGTVTHWLINALNTVTGNLDRPGGAMFASPPVDLGQILRVLWGPSRHGRHHSRVDGFPELHGELPVVAMPSEITTPGEGQVRALITVAGNPALSSPDAERVQGALEQLDFMVSVDMYLTETSRMADVILPPVSHLERDDLDVVFPFFSVRNNLRWSPKVFQPADGAKTDWEILLRLAAEVPTGPATAPVRTAMRTVGGLVSDDLATTVLVTTGPRGRLRNPLRGLRVKDAKTTPGGLDLGPLEPRLPGLLRTPDKKVHLAPPLLLDAAADMDLTAPAPDGFDLRLIGRRHLRSNNSWLHNVPAMVKGRDRCTVLMHPDDAEARSLDDGGPVLVASSVGEIEVPLQVSDEMRPGVVSIPHGWGHDVKGVGWSTAAANGGVNANVLTDASLVDALSGNAAVNATWVRVTVP